MNSPLNKRLTFLKILGVIGAALPLLILCSPLFYWWDSKVNRGHSFGYWGEFNNTSNALASIPNIKITSSWHHLDLTLEEFGFEIETNGQHIRLGFEENDPIRTMSKKDAITSLKKQTEIELKLQAK